MNRTTQMLFAEAAAPEQPFRANMNTESYYLASIMSARITLWPREASVVLLFTKCSDTPPPPLPQTLSGRHMDEWAAKLSPLVKIQKQCEHLLTLAP